MKKIIMIILSLVVILTIVFVLFNKKTTSRIDLTTNLVDENIPQFEVYVDGSETPLKQMGWMSKNNLQGYVVQKDGKNMDMIIKSLSDAKIKLSFRGLWEKDAENKMVEHWVKYTSINIDGNEILSEPVNVWHDKPFVYTIDAKNGAEYKIQIKWTKSDK